MDSQFDKPLDTEALDEILQEDDAPSEETSQGYESPSVEESSDEVSSPDPVAFGSTVHKAVEEAVENGDDVVDAVEEAVSSFSTDPPTEEEATKEVPKTEIETLREENTELEQQVRRLKNTISSQNAQLAAMRRSQLGKN